MSEYIWTICLVVVFGLASSSSANASRLATALYAFATALSALAGRTSAAATTFLMLFGLGIATTVG
jgi:hypothetical protein